jgi:hypothetical protein
MEFYQNVVSTFQLFYIASTEIGEFENQFLYERQFPINLKMERNRLKRESIRIKRKKKPILSLSSAYCSNFDWRI